MSVGYSYLHKCVYIKVYSTTTISSYLYIYIYISWLCVSVKDLKNTLL